MSDEQVHLIVDALAGNPWEPALAFIATLASVAVGFGLSQWSERRARRRAAEQRRSDLRNTLAVSAMELVYTLGAYSASSLRQSGATKDVAARVAAFQGYGPEGRDVGQWWAEQIARLTNLPQGSGDFTDSEHTARLGIGRDVIERLRLWNAGELDGASISTYTAPVAREAPREVSDE